MPYVYRLIYGNPDDVEGMLKEYADWEPTHMVGRSVAVSASDTGDELRYSGSGVVVRHGDIVILLRKNVSKAVYDRWET